MLCHRSWSVRWWERRDSYRAWPHIRVHFSDRWDRNSWWSIDSFTGWSSRTSSGGGVTLRILERETFSIARRGGAQEREREIYRKSLWILQTGFSERWDLRGAWDSYWSLYHSQNISRGLRSLSVHSMSLQYSYSRVWSRVPSSYGTA